MTVFLKAATAVTVLIGPFVDNTDGYTPETGLTITASEVLLSKNGGALAAKSEVNSAAHDAAGHYAVNLDANDTDTPGALRIAVNESGAFPVWLDCVVLPAAVYDALIDGNNPLQVDVTAWKNTTVPTPDTAGYPKVTIKDGTGTGELDTASGKVSVATGGITAGSFAAGAIDAAAIGTGAIDADAMAADVGPDIFQSTALTESYAADGATATPAQLLYMIWALLAEKAVSATTLTVKKLDGSTTAMTFTLSDATNPVSVTRAS